jgi:hypothetical protein
MVTSVLKPTDMTIHWKALEEHFPMVPLVFWFNHFWEKNEFSDIFSLKKPQSFSGLTEEEEYSPICKPPVK